MTKVQISGTSHGEADDGPKQDETKKPLTEGEGEDEQEHDSR